MLSKSYLPYVTAAVLFASQAAAQSQEEIDDYPFMASQFAKHGITWESFKIKTENGYTTTAFHVTGSVDTGPFEITKPALIMQHGMGGDSSVWTETISGATHPGKVPMAF